MLVGYVSDERYVALADVFIEFRSMGQTRAIETQATAMAVIRDCIEPVLLGRDPRDITANRRAMEFAVKVNPFTRAAVEMAMWDIAGKAVGLPVYQLLGGKVRDRVSWQAWRDRRD